MSHRPMFIPTRRRLTAGNALMLAALLAGLALPSYWGHQSAASTQLQAAQDSGRLLGYDQAMNELGDAVAAAWRVGYQSGQVDTCTSNQRREAPL